MSEELVLGCDVGSQGTNVALYTAGGELVASADEPYDVSFPAPGWAEQDPGLWIEALAGAIRRVLAELGGKSSAIKGMSFGSQLDGVVAVDASGEPLRPALIWMRIPAKPRLRYYTDDERAWSTPTARRRIENAIFREGSISCELFGTETVRSFLRDWFERGAAPAQAVGAMYVYEAYQRDLAAFLHSAVSKQG